MTDGELEAFLAAGHTMNVATVNHDRSLHLVAMWYAMIDAAPVFWTYSKSQKINNLQRDPRITALVETGEVYEELRGAELVGRGQIITDPAEVQQLGWIIANKYQGPLTEDARPFVEQVGAKRFAVRIQIDRVVTWDHSKLGGTY